MSLHPTDFLKNSLDAGAEARPLSASTRHNPAIYVLPVWCIAPLYAGLLGGARHHLLHKSSVQLF